MRQPNIDKRRKLWRILWLIVALELAWSGLWLGYRATSLAAPEVNFSLVDDVTAADLRQVHQELMQSVASGQADSQSWLAMADAYATYGYFREASRYYRRAIEEDPYDSKATFRWALCMDRLARYPEAIELFEEAASLARDPRSSQACYYFIGKIHLKLEQPEEALKAFQRGKNHVPCQYEMANLLIRTGRVAEAEPMLQSLERYSNAIGTHLIRARAAEARGDQQAMTLHNDAAERGDEIPLYLTDRGYLKKFHSLYGASRMSTEGYELAQQGKQKEGLDILHTAFEQNRVVRMQPFYVQLELAVEGPAAAREMIQNWFDRSGESPEFLEVLGDTYMQEGAVEQAEVAWLRAAKLRGTASIHEKLTGVYQQQQDEEKIRYHQGGAAYEKGVAAYRANDLETARLSLEIAVERLPDKANGWFYLGQTSRVLGNLTRAREAYEKCLAIDPYHGRANQFLPLVVSSSTPR
ncbi:MAG: tetratricopeptide repeat protein [Planctomycetales bacterium]|nr:tetratricopeptide repeat protein [Planctomycetales bacterium]